MPEGKGPFPAVVLVSGSGPNDMDSTVGPNKPFRDLAEGLAAHGIASIRYTKRTRQYGPKLGKDITLAQEILDDAVSAVKLLRATPGIDPKRVFVAGHSLGGYAAPWIGQADPSLAGLIILAGATRPVDVLIDEQVRYLGVDPARGEEIKKMMSDAYRAEVSRDPVPVARELKMPMLVLQGARDYQVTLTDFAGWKKIEGPRVTLKLYPAMNHLFQPGQGKSLPMEYRMVAPFSPVVIDDIAEWIKKR
jgi:dienelactone hydrolase